MSLVLMLLLKRPSSCLAKALAPSKPPAALHPHLPDNDIHRNSNASKSLTNLALKDYTAAHAHICIRYTCKPKTTIIAKVQYGFSYVI